MMDQITCPNCGQSFDVELALSGKIEAHFRSEYEKKVAQQAERFNLEKKNLEEQRTILLTQKDQFDQLIKTEVSKALYDEKIKIEKSTKEIYEDRIKFLQEENDKKKGENKIFKEKEIDLLKREAAIIEKQEELTFHVEKQILERQKDIEEKARAKERESFELEKLKLLKQIDDNKKLAEEMKRKAEQGSMQLQGEIQELAIEEILKATYPFDEIKEVPKGVRGADTIQVVVNSSQQICGSIVYESKRTKNFVNDWIDKLKQDQVLCKADIALLVTETYPSDMDRFGEKNGVWICSYQELRSLSFVLRQILIKSNSVKLSQENKGDKMELLYNYLTSNEFVQNIKRIVENYDAMAEQLNSEKKAIMKIWAIREKQIWVVHENLTSMFGSIKGIAGAELNSVDIFELPEN